MTGRTALFCAGLAALVALPHGAAAAAPDRSQIEQLRGFASCAGRLLALRDHLALFGGDGVESAESRRAAHVAVLDALLELAPDGFDERRVFHWRVDARAAQSAVLSQAAFGTSEETRRRAASASERHIAQCDRMILGV